MNNFINRPVWDESMEGKKIQMRGNRPRRDKLRRPGISSNHQGWVRTIQWPVSKRETPQKHFLVKNVDEEDIRKDFSTVGNVCRIVQNFQRVFIRFREKEEAQRAIMKFGKIYDVDMAKNNKNRCEPVFPPLPRCGPHFTPHCCFYSDHQPEGGNNNNLKAGCNPPSNIAVSDNSISTTGDKINPGSKVFHLILGNLPKNYTIKDVNALVEEAKPICINQMDETRVFNVKFCHIVVDSFENLSYLIDKLNGFVICGEKLIASEAKNLLEWRERAV